MVTEHWCQPLKMSNNQQYRQSEELRKNQTLHHGQVAMLQLIRKNGKLFKFLSVSSFTFGDSSDNLADTVQEWKVYKQETNKLALIS